MDTCTMDHVFESPDPIDSTVLLTRTGLATFEHHAIVCSTMERARELAVLPNCPLPAAVVADMQSLGRGQRGARWWQAPGSLAVSVVVDATRQAQDNATAGPPAVWSLACGVALAESVAAVAPGIEPMVRWPNDIEANGRKLAGILVEATPGGRAIFGIGVNTTGSCGDAPPPLDRKIVTVPDLTGSSLPRERLLVDFLPRLFALLAATAVDPEAFVARYRARCGLDGHPITVFSGDERLTGLCRGIAADGRLVLDTSSGRVHVSSGSLTHPADIWRGA
jgi:BirA family transcriptional regulator, biotin operon repressor / biotin---[acetyl-CoA-carboxylase] ligase